MNTRYIKQHLLAAILCLAATAATAQDLRTAYFLEDFKWRHDMNPAFGNDQFYLALPFSNLNVNTQGTWGVDNFLFENPNWGRPGEKRTVTFMHPDISYDQSIGKLKNGLKNLVNIRETVLGVGFKGFGGYNTIDLNVKANVGLSLPKSLLEFMKSVHNDDYRFDDIALRGQAYAELALGHSRQVNEQLRVGARLKALVGVARADVSMTGTHVNLEGDTWYVEGQATANVNMDGLRFKTEREQYKSAARQGQYYDKVTDVDTDDLKFIGGKGMAVDLGATYELQPGLTLSAALTDLGFIHWKNSARAQTVQERFAFEGFQDVAIDDDLDGSLDDKADDYADRLADFLNLATDNDAGAQTHGIGWTANLGVEYQMPFYKQLSAGLLLTRHFDGPNFSWNEARLSANVAPLRMLSMALSYGLGSYGSSLGGVLYLHPGVVNFFIGVDRLAFTKYAEYDGVPVPMKPNANVVVGLNLAFGGKGSNKKR